MDKFWRVALHEYTRHVLQKRFLFALLSVPLMIAVMILLIFILIRMEIDPTPLGYIDHSGLLANSIPQPTPEPPDRPIPMLPFQAEEQAQAALQAGEIKAYYVLPADYLQTGQAKIVYIEEPKDAAYDQFNAFLAVNLLADHPAAVSRRLTEGNEVVIRSVDNSREASEKRWFNILMPFFVGLMFVAAIGTSSGYLMQAVVEEKENRTMEVLITSVSPVQFMSGKIIADIAIGLTQLIGWTIFAALAVVIGRNYLDWLQALEIPWDLVGLTVVVMIPAFVMICALMAAIGATVTEASEAQQMTGLIMLPIWLPFILISVLMTNPNGALAVILSFIPFTAPMTITLRAGFTIIPTWEIVVTVTVLTLTALGSLWLAGRAFRLGMLRYGQRLRWAEVFSRKGA